MPGRTTKRLSLWNGVERRAPAMVLVVGDDPDSNELLCRILTARGYRTASATDTESGLARVGELVPRCVVLDLAAGGIGSNLKVLDTMRNHPDERVASTRVVLVARSRANAVFSYQSGVDEFLVRPFHADDLVARIRASIARSPAERAEHRARSIADAG